MAKPERVDYVIFNTNGKMCVHEPGTPVDHIPIVESQPRVFNFQKLPPERFHRIVPSNSCALVPLEKRYF